MMVKNILIGLDSGTSVVKAVAFDLSGQQLDSAATPNHYVQTSDGTAAQSMAQTWSDSVETLRALARKIPDLSERTAAVAVTAQGDGTWLVGANDAPVGDAWLWLDSRAAPTVERMRALPSDAIRFRATGTGLNACQQGMQLVHMRQVMPELVEQAEVAMHCKDWLYLKLTGERVTDPSEACFTFGNFRTRQYDDAVIESLGLEDRRSLLPPIVDGTQQYHPLSEEAARQTGLLPGTPICLGYVDVVCTAMGAGIYDRSGSVGCSIVGSTGMHMLSMRDSDVQLNEERTGYAMALPVPGMAAQMQSNMAATLNIDWLLDMAVDLVGELGQRTSRAQLLKQVNRWLAEGRSGSLLYHPYISEAGERGPFIDNNARASFVGLNSTHRFADLIRAVVEGLSLAAVDCYAAMGVKPQEIRLSGGAARSEALRTIFSAALDAPVRYASRDEAGAAGAAMMAAVAIGVYDSMDACVESWVNPLLSDAEHPDTALTTRYRALFGEYVTVRQALAPSWRTMATLRAERS